MHLLEILVWRKVQRTLNVAVAIKHENGGVRMSMLFVSDAPGGNLCT